MATRGYQGMLGLTTDSPLGVLPPPVSSGSAIGAFTALFPARADGWPGAGAWVTRAARELPSWIEQQSVNRDAGVQLLALLTLRLHQMSDKPAAQAAVERLSAVLRSAVVSVKASTLAVSVADKVGLPIDLAVAQALVRQNRLHVSRIPGVIARTAQAEGADRALQLGEEAARFTSSEDVLAQLVAIAKQAGDSAKVGHWQSRQKEAASARTRLSQQEGAAQPVGQP
jgi:hypothetical protein